MKIAMIFHSLNVRGGSVSAFLSLAKALQSHGNEVDIYCYSFDRKNCFPELTGDLTIHSVIKMTTKPQQLDNSSVLNRFSLAADYYFHARKVYSLMKKERYDVIYASEASAYIPALMYKVNHKMVPVYWSVFDPISLVDKHRPGLLINKYTWFAYLLRLHNLYDRRNIRKIDYVIVSTGKMKKRMDTFYSINSLILPTAGVRNEDINKNTDFSNLIDKRLKKLFDFEKKHEKILLSSGHFLPHRRYEDIVFAMKKLINEQVNVKCIITGSKNFDQAYYSRIFSLVKELHLEKYVFIDSEFKSNDEVLGYYQYCDYFLFVGSGQNWGLAPLEALVQKKPVIISDGVEVSEVLSSKNSALIIPEKNPNEIVKAVKTLIKDKQRAKAMAEDGHRFVIHNLTYAAIADSLIHVFSTNNSSR